MILGVAQLQLEGQFSTGDNLDTKAFGVLTIDIATASLVVGFRDQFGSFWGLPLVLFILSATPAVFMVIARSFDSGPQVEDFYNTYSDEEERTAAARMLSEIVPALKRNDRVLSQKLVASILALALMALGLVASTVLFVTRPNVGIGCQSHPTGTATPLVSASPQTHPRGQLPNASPPSRSNPQRCLIGS